MPKTKPKVPSLFSRIAFIYSTASTMYGGNCSLYALNLWFILDRVFEELAIWLAIAFC